MVKSELLYALLEMYFIIGNSPGHLASQTNFARHLDRVGIKNHKPVRMRSSPRHPPTRQKKRLVLKSEVATFDIFCSNRHMLSERELVVSNFNVVTVNESL